MGFGKFDCPGGPVIDNNYCHCPRCTGLREVLYNSFKGDYSMYGFLPTKFQELSGKYVVWAPGSSLPVTKVYDDRPTAIKVATLMANKDPQSQFCVCKIVGSAKTARVEYNGID